MSRQLPVRSTHADGQSPGTNPGTLVVSELFTSIQGEGMLTGVPSAFVRVSGCNLRCGWCDTPYASWDAQGSAMAADEVGSWVLGTGVQHAVITGGEPMLFDAIEPLTHRLRSRGVHVTIETAGTIHRPADRLACDLLSVSPKLASSTPQAGDPRDPTGAWRARHEQRRLPIQTLRALLRDFPQHQIKLVVSSPTDLPEIDALLEKLQPVEPGRVLLMPQGTVPHEPGSLDWLVRACIDRRARYCHRVHIDVFGHRRGT